VIDDIDDAVEAWRTDGQGNWYGVARLVSTGGLGVPVTDIIPCKVPPPGAWTSDRPAAGKWWVALHQDNRDELAQPTWPVEAVVRQYDKGLYVEMLGVEYELGCWLFDGALWLPRETPADPFAVDRPASAVGS
jgi:hypothetical protein